MELTMIIAGIAGLAIFLVMYGLAQRTRDAKIEERLDQYATREVEALEERRKGRDRGDSGLAGRLNRAISKRGSADLATQLARADLKIKASEYILINIASVLVFFLLGLVLFHGSLLLAFVAGVFGFYAPRMYMRYRQRKRVSNFDNQLSDALNLLVNSLRSGYSLLQAMEAVSRELPAPISTEFARVVQEVGLGLSVEQSMNNMLRRIQSDDLDMCITAINVQHEVGGNLAEILETISHTIRERVRIRGEIQVLTAQQRITAYLIGFLPVGLGLVLYVINEEYMGLMFSELCGWIQLAVAVTIVTIGFLIIRKIVAIEV